ncbi:hypothetical protein ABZ892_00330 [Streptomyces sp. NPDC046924]
MSEPPTPSQAEGERDDDDRPGPQASPPHPTPSQAEVERDDDEEPVGG